MKPAVSKPAEGPSAKPKVTVRKRKPIRQIIADFRHSFPIRLHLAWICLTDRETPVLIYWRQKREKLDVHVWAGGRVDPDRLNEASRIILAKTGGMMEEVES